MQAARIYHISHGRQFPFEYSERGPFRMDVCELAPSQLDQAEVPQAGGDAFALLLMQCESGRIADDVQLLRGARSLDAMPKILILPSEEYASSYREAALIPRAVVLDDQIRPRHLQAIAELVLQQEYYRQTVYRLSRDVRDRSGVFENLMELARRELKGSLEETDAYRSLLEYEQGVRKFDENIVAAMESAGALRDAELLTMKKQLEATESLSDFRENELQQARATLTAAEAALDMSRQENIEREKIISALERLRSFTDRELLELWEENQELRRRLGLPPSEQPEAGGV